MILHKFIKDLFLRSKAGLFIFYCVCFFDLKCQNNPKPLPYAPGDLKYDKVVIYDISGNRMPIFYNGTFHYEEVKGQKEIRRSQADSLHTLILQMGNCFHTKPLTNVRYYMEVIYYLGKKEVAFLQIMKNYSSFDISFHKSNSSLQWGRVLRCYTDKQSQELDILYQSCGFSQK